MSATIEGVREALRGGARLDVVRLLFLVNSNHKWGVQVWKKDRTRGGNEKWTKVVLLVPNDGETVGDLLKMLGEMVEEEQ